MDTITLVEMQAVDYFCFDQTKLIGGGGKRKQKKLFFLAFNRNRFSLPQTYIHRSTLLWVVGFRS
jgi:hypothetical protein